MNHIGTKTAIACELYTAMYNLGADHELLAVIGSYGDTLDDESVLRYLRDYNNAGAIIHVAT